MVGRKVALGAVTAVLLLSAGGGFLALPVLVPAYVWAARRSGRAGRVGWGLAAGLGAGEVAWAALYVLAGERQPFIWAVPLVAGAAVAALVARS